MVNFFPGTSVLRTRMRANIGGILKPRGRRKKNVNSAESWVSRSRASDVGTQGGSLSVKCIFESRLQSSLGSVYLFRRFTTGSWQREFSLLIRALSFGLHDAHRILHHSSALDIQCALGQLH